ncbi:Thiamine-monophosphate kinase [Phycisphaerae bacterium RAS1]|nr:Thiamine-monophosphate kinase [Phycisphaerae bacterium RAS1]
MTRSNEKDELHLIREIAGRLAPRIAGGVPFGDDMATIAPGGELLWTVDMLMDGVDFDSRRHDWRAIGRKAMAVNLSDCAAMAVHPQSALIAVALNDALSMDDALALFDGAQACADEFVCEMTGGDTNSWAWPTVVSITVAARPDPDFGPVMRGGARPGDQIYVSGLLGGSIVGRHLTFQPRVREALQIARLLQPHAMIDISDGLALDVSRIAEASGCGALLDAAGLDGCIHPDARTLAQRDGRSAREHALSDGEDFELAVVVHADVIEDRIAPLGLRRVGEMIRQPGLFLREAGEIRPLEPCGWRHFRGASQ